MSTLRQRRRANSNGRVTESAATDVDEDEQKRLENEEKWRKWRTRGWTTIAMIIGFFGILAAGIGAVVLFIFMLMVLAYREIDNLFVSKAQADGLPTSNRLLNWYWFGVLTFMMLGRVAVLVLSRTFGNTLLLQYLLRYHAFLTALAFFFGVITFVLLLEKGKYKIQFKQLAWSFMALVLVIIPSTFWVMNAMNSLFWMLFPASLIVCNDCCAYIFGFFFGKTPLIKLSPKKTWEGFIGGAVSTVVWALFFAWLLMHFDALICPQTELWTMSSTQCARPLIFEWTAYPVPSFVAQLVAAVVPMHVPDTVTLLPIHLHALAFATFASVIAPFGGFFASGFKRAFKLKDFADTIPGHGGVLDRMDCQFMMGLFTYVYVHSFVISSASVETILQMITHMPLAHQREVLAQLQAMIVHEVDPVVS